MMRILCIFALLGNAVAATPHYSQPPCQSDEVELEIKDFETNYTGKVCAPACGDNDSCPTDKPPSAAAPKCILHDSGKKYCGLKCFMGCGNDHMTCLKVDKTTRVCAYRPAPSPPKAKPCCQGHCADPTQEKYYSIAKSLWGTKHCGECCMDPKKYNLFHHFESNLTKADNDSPCKGFGYPIYDSTATHGFGPISMTLDLYDLPKESLEQAAVVTPEVVATRHYSQPPCQSDEVELEIKDFETNYTGKVCAPACGDNDSCPTDKPPSAAAPKCILHDSGKKYCGLKCFLGCGNDHMTCLKIDKTTRVCAYRPAPSPPKAKPCCQGHCADPTQEKYYSIAKSLWGTKHCGECCMDPKKYNLFHHFESNLTKADNDSPCKGFGYPIYDSTATHGFGPISMTLDLYDLPKKTIDIVV